MNDVAPIAPGDDYTGASIQVRDIQYTHLEANGVA